MDWFPYDNGLRHERVNQKLSNLIAILVFLSELIKTRPYFIVSLQVTIM